MRSLGLSLIAALGLMATTAVAQNYLPGNYPPPPVTQPGTPPGTNPATGARPGNVIGTGSSLPRSNRASNITPSDTRSSVAPNLPSPPIGENASPRAYLIAARGALAAGRTGEAQQSLEMAQTRLLDRSVPLFQTNTPARDPAVDQNLGGSAGPWFGRSGARDADHRRDHSAGGGYRPGAVRITAGSR